MPDLVGQSLGRYHILEQIGEGGMATVYKAYDTHLERDVAIKIIRRKAFPEEQLDHILKRFEREAKALARLTHPNIVPVIDYGEYEGAPYLVMIYLPGGTIHQPLGTPMRWQQAVHLLLPIAEALAYAHGHNVVHRDIKPSNILLTEKGQPMLSDFGIAKILGGGETATLTGTGVGVGTPGYMAPEQWTGNTVSQSDIYSLGVVLYELVTGRKPYTGDTPAAILLKQATEPLPRPSQFAPGLPRPFEEMLQKALARDPTDRYVDMAAFIGTLEELLVVTPLPVRSTLPLGKEDSKASLEQNNDKKKRQQEAAQASLDVEEKARRQAEVTRLSGETRSAIQKNKWKKTEQLAGELAGLGEAGKSAAAGLLEQMKERQATQQARALARLRTEEQAKLDDARRMQELRQQKEQKAAEQERLKAEAAKRKETATQQAAEEKTQRAAIANAQRLEEIARLQPAIETALADRQWDKARRLIIQLSSLKPEGRVLADHLKKALPEQKLPAWVWVTGSLVIVGIIISMAVSLGGNPPASPTPPVHSSPTVIPTTEAPTVPLQPSDTPNPSIPASSPTAPAPIAITSYDAVFLNTANVRNGPGTIYSLLDIYPAGTKVQILGRNRNGDWVAFTLPNGRQGWTSLDNLQLSFDVFSLPELKAPPAPTFTPLLPTNSPQVVQPTTRPTLAPP